MKKKRRRFCQVGEEEGQAARRLRPAALISRMADDVFAGSERAPLLDDAEDETEAGDPNRLTGIDGAWLVLQGTCAVLDALALRALLQRRFKGALFFGGHTQLLGNWSLCLSFASHAVTIYAALAIEPAPKTYNMRRHVHREKTYLWAAALSGSAVIFCTVVMACQSLLLALGEDKFARQHVIPDMWLDFGVPGAAWLVLLLKRERHWMGAASRFILRKALLWPTKWECGHTYAHCLLWCYLLWTLVCRLLGGRWVYRVVAAAEARTPAPVFWLLYAVVAVALHAALWLVWRAARFLLLCRSRPKTA